MNVSKVQLISPYQLNKNSTPAFKAQIIPTDSFYKLINESEAVRLSTLDFNKKKVLNFEDNSVEVILDTFSKPGQQASVDEFGVKIPNSILKITDGSRDAHRYMSINENDSKEDIDKEFNYAFKCAVRDFNDVE